MRIFTEQAVREYAEKHPESKVALQDWVQKVKKSEWSCFADIKKTFNSVDNVGN
ncbi:MAG TPA: type II toxin-antitoxin system HigB family toxin, partial [Parabacteroides goldsteinii]|nr:type II toxin-antitoxin system HigB family toxin [Parabacteroides goldsteinii]